MNYEMALFSLIVVFFSIIHFIEVSSFLARYSGVQTGDNAMAYATQSAVFMATRFFSMLLLPILGLIVDLGVTKSAYLTAVGLAVCGAALGGVLSIFLRGRLVACFTEIVQSVKSGASLLRLLAFLPIKIFSVSPVNVPIGTLKSYVQERVFWFSALVFALYATSVFIAFYFGLVFPAYRTSISQLSAVTNAFATVLLTFYIEPRISVAIDRKDAPGEKILTLLFGRIFGVGVLSHIPLLVLWGAF